MRALSLVPIALGSLAAACGADDHGGDDGGSVNCAAEPDQDDFIVGFTKPGIGATLDFQLVSLAPAPPARGDNEWVIQVNALAGGTVGSPVNGATIAATPFMPKHGHGTPIDVEVEPMTADGQYKLSPVNLWMPGLWETTVEVSSAGGTDMVVFKVCIPG